MLVQYSKIINSPVVELQTQTQIGVVDDLVIHKTKLEVYGIVLKKSSILSFGEPKAVTSTDIVEINPQATIVNNADSAVPLSEAVRLKEAIEQKYKGIYQRIVSKNGKNIGLVYDYLIDSTTQKISKFYCRTLLAEKIISARSVIKIEGKKITIKDEFEAEKITTPAVESSPV
jgi:uncharacterized protein YrrD